MSEGYRGSYLFGLNFWAGGFGPAKDALMRDALGSGSCKLVITPNVDHVVRLSTDLSHDEEFLNAYAAADYLFPDGTPIVWLSRLAGRAIRERVTGADLFPAICDAMAARGRGVFLLGGRPGDEGHIKQALTEKYAGLKVDVFAPSFPFDPTGTEAEQACRKANESNAAIVFVCLGMPRQERWAIAFKSRLSAKLALCVGATIDFELGSIARAPKWAQRIGMEWFWRMCSDPRRLARRYAMDVYHFVPMAVQELIKSCGGKA